jgi:antitoxin component YwqK of YwqJK toxin-antitoxin module
MKKTQIALLTALAALSAGCQNATSTDSFLSQSFVHKYGFDLSEKEWKEGPQDGQAIVVMQNGVKVMRSFDQGTLHGPTTYTFPNSDIVEKLFVYDQGQLLKQLVNDSAGIPVRQEMYEFDNRTIVTMWDEKGVPLSIEEYKDELLEEGQYFTPEHQLEAQVEKGSGERVKRDRSGLLLSRDQIENGIMAARTTFHPNGQMHTVSRYDNYQLHGEQMKYTVAGRPLMKLTWNHGVLNGPKIVYRNGIKIAEIPYVKGQKDGMETHYDDLGNLSAEIEWKQDKKHGCTKFYSEELTEQEWFFKGQPVQAERFEVLQQRDEIFSETVQ